MESTNLPEFIKSQILFPDILVVRPADYQTNISNFIQILELQSRSQNHNSSTEQKFNLTLEDPPHLNDIHFISSNNNRSFQLNDKNFYLEYCNIQSFFNERMAPDFLYDGNFTLFGGKTPFLDVDMKNIWFGNGKTLGKLHFDAYDNLLCQISGSKNLLISPPYNNSHFYEGHLREAVLSLTDLYSPIERKMDGLSQTTAMVMSPVDIKNINSSRFPLFEKARFMNCTINPGDVLYLPSFWWHEVQSTPDEREEIQRNIAVNFWYKPFLEKSFPCEKCPLKVSDHYYHSLTPDFFEGKRINNNKF